MYKELAQRNCGPRLTISSNYMIPTDCRGHKLGDRPDCTASFDNSRNSDQTGVGTVDSLVGNFPAHCTVLLERVVATDRGH